MFMFACGCICLMALHAGTEVTVLMLTIMMTCFVGIIVFVAFEGITVFVNPMHIRPVRYHLHTGFLFPNTHHKRAN